MRRGARRALQFLIAVSMALFFSYLILQAR